MFCALMLFMCSILCLMCSGSSLHVECIFWDGVFVCVEDDVCSVYVWWRLNVREISLDVCSELCPVCFLIVCECVSVLFCCSLYLVRVLIVVIMGRWSEFSACILCQVVRLYSVVEIVVMSGEVACCSVVCGTLVGVSVYSMMCSELRIMSEIS